MSRRPATRCCKMLEAARIKAIVEIVPGKDTLEALRDRSRASAVVMIGYDPPEDENAPLFSPELIRLRERVPARPSGLQRRRHLARRLRPGVIGNPIKTP